MQPVKSPTTYKKLYTAMSRSLYFCAPKKFMQ